MADIWAAINVSNFTFTARSSSLDWRLLHGIDVDEVVRHTDIATLEGAVECLQRGSIDAEPSELSPHNYVQLFRLLQLAVEYLWQLREGHARLYTAYTHAIDAAQCWRAAAETYLEAGNRFLDAYRDQAGFVSDDLIEAAHQARAKLQLQDSVYSHALDGLEVEDTAARRFTLRRQRLELNWRQVFSADLQRLVISRDTAQLEALLPVVAYGNLMAEEPSQLTTRHYRQLIKLAQCQLDLMWHVCKETGKALGAKVQQLQAHSATIPELTTATEEMRQMVAAALEDAIRYQQQQQQQQQQQGASSSAHHSAHVTAQYGGSRPGTAMSGRFDMQGCPGNSQPASPTQPGPPFPASPSVAAPATPAATTGWGVPQNAAAQQATWGLPQHAAAQQAVTLAGSSHWAASLQPRTGALKTKLDGLENNLRDERTRTEHMRRSMEEIASMVAALPDSQPASPTPPTPRAPPAPAPVLVQPAIDDPGRVRINIDEDAIRCSERDYAQSKLCQHINGIIMSLEQQKMRRSSLTRQKQPSIVYRTVRGASRESAPYAYSNSDALMQAAMAAASMPPGDLAGGAAGYSGRASMQYRGSSGYERPASRVLQHSHSTSALYASGNMRSPVAAALGAGGRWDGRQSGASYPADAPPAGWGEAARAAAAGQLWPPHGQGGAVAGGPALHQPGIASTAPLPAGVIPTVFEDLSLPSVPHHTPGSRGTGLASPQQLAQRSATQDLSVAASGPSHAQLSRNSSPVPAGLGGGPLSAGLRRVAALAS